MTIRPEFLSTVLRTKLRPNEVFVRLTRSPDNRLSKLIPVTKITTNNGDVTFSTGALGVSGWSRRVTLYRLDRHELIALASAPEIICHQPADTLHFTLEFR